MDAEALILSHAFDPPVPGIVFEATCDGCKKVTGFEESMRERRVAKGDMAAARGDFKPELEFSFRCTACGHRSPKMMDRAGVLHKWQGSKHASFKP